MKVISVALGSVTLPDEDAEMIKQAQRVAIMKDPTMAAATLVGAQADAMKAAAENPGGAMTGFMGVGMAAGAGGMNAQNLFAMGQEQAASQQTQTASATSQPQTTADKWTCPNGHEASGKFCPECGSPKPVSDSWTCTCGAVNKGKFCSNCGQPKPEPQRQYRCSNCGWQPEDAYNPPKFCPECGNVFDENDLV